MYIDYRNLISLLTKSFLKILLNGFLKMINSQRKGEKSRKPIGERYQEISER
jgi:hypothetical protein